MNPTNSEEKKRGRKPADKWSYVVSEEIQADPKKGIEAKPEVKLSIAITVPDVSELSEEFRNECAEVGLRQKAGAAFRKELDEMVPAIAENIKGRDEVIAAFHPDEKQLTKFMKGKVTEFPTEWTFKP